MEFSKHAENKKFRVIDLIFQDLKVKDFVFIVIKLFN